MNAGRGNQKKKYLKLTLQTYKVSGVLVDCTDVPHCPQHYYHVLTVHFTVLEQINQNLHSPTVKECVGVSCMT